jgi:hypothetical protein
MRTSLLLLALLAACSRPSAAPSGRAQEPRPPAAALAVLEHDFGVIPHGGAKRHEFPLDLAALGEPWIPLRVHLDCSCGHADLRLRKADGTERFVIPNGSTANLPTAEERLWLCVVLDTAEREAIDVPRTTSHGYVVLQHPKDLTGTERIQWPIRLHFAIEAPVLLRPLATLDFGRVPQSQTAHLVTTLRGDERHADAVFGPAACDDPRLDVALARDGEHWLLRASCRPGEPGNHRARIQVGTSIPGYRLHLAATWKSIPDLEATPVPKLSFRAPLGRAQTTAEASSQFLLVVDHDVSRSPEFEVARIVADDGRDLAACFDVAFEPLPPPSRQQRMTVRYTGGLHAATRGSLVLAKDRERGPFLPIELVVFAAKEP